MSRGLDTRAGYHASLGKAYINLPVRWDKCNYVRICLHLFKTKWAGNSLTQAPINLRITGEFRNEPSSFLLEIAVLPKFTAVSFTYTRRGGLHSRGKGGAEVRLYPTISVTCLHVSPYLPQPKGENWCWRTAKVPNCRHWRRPPWFVGLPKSHALLTPCVLGRRGRRHRLTYERRFRVCDLPTLLRLNKP